MDRLHLNRATVAGVGTTAALVAAVVAVSVVVGGLVAYTASPKGPLVSGQPSLVLPQTGPMEAVTGSSNRPLVVPRPVRRAARAARAAVRPAGRVTTPPSVAPTATKIVAPVKPGQREGPSYSDTEAAPPVDPGPRPGSGSITEPARELSETVAETTTVAGNGLGTAVQQTTGGLDQLTAPLVPSLSPVLDAVGQGAAALITATTDALATVIRRLGGGSAG